MLDMGFLKPVEKIIAAVMEATGQRPQTMLFSATFEDAIEKVAQRVLQNPIRVQLAAAKQTHSSITHKAYMADDSTHKKALLQKLLRQKDVAQAIIFTATKRNADKLAEALYDSGFSASALHGDMKQNQRKRTLQGLHSGTLQVLVATDVAARGLDVKNLSHVFNYDLPNLPDDFTHRIGRTGRGGAVGIAISIVSPPDLPVLRDIEKRLGKPFPFETFEGLESQYTEADFRKIVPSEPPPGRPKPKPRGGGGGRSGGGYGGGGYNAKGQERSGPRSDNGGGFGAKREGGFGGAKREGGSFGGKREGGFGGKTGGPRREGGRPQRRDSSR
jgi:superfamily II DNA/RNA helicase